MNSSFWRLKSNLLSNVKKEQSIPKCTQHQVGKEWFFFFLTLNACIGASNDTKCSLIKLFRGLKLVRINTKDCKKVQSTK